MRLRLFETRRPGWVAVLLLACAAACGTAAAPATPGEGEGEGETSPWEAEPESDAAPVPARVTDAGRDAASSDAAGRSDARALPCPADMADIGAFCMDRYEAPNEKGQPPLAFQTAPEGEQWCAARGKRLCTESEWVRACEGASGSPYPYGDTYVKSTCNDDKIWRAPNWTALGTYPAAGATAEATRLYQADPSGSRAQCVAEEGVMDLTGNVAEWVVRSFDHATNYDHVMKGCYWSGCYGGSGPSCGFTNPAHPGTFRTYEAGFRCCSGRLGSE